LSTITPAHYDFQARKFGFTDFFEHAYTGIVDKREKIGHILRDHGLQAHETLFAGDMVHDVATAHHAGVLAVALLSGFDDHAKLAAAVPDVIVRDLGDLQLLMETVAGRGLIKIDGLQIDVHVGVPDEEIAHAARLLLDIEIVPLRSFLEMREDVAQTVDYYEVCEAVRAFTAAGRWRLIESLAADLRQLILARPNVANARVKVRKFILPYTEQVSVEV
jgi:phosphoglycolate phosphatase